MPTASLRHRVLGSASGSLDTVKVKREGRRVGHGAVQDHGSPAPGFSALARSSSTVARQMTRSRFEQLEERRLLSAGQLLGSTVTDFGSFDTGRAVAFDTLGRPIVAGNAGGAFAFARYTSAGTATSLTKVDALVPGSSPVATALTLGNTGDIYVGGFSRGAVTLTSGDDFVVRRYDATTGNLISSAATRFGNTNADQISSLVTLPDGRVLAVGTSAGNIALAMYNPNLTLDTTFGVNGLVATNVGPAVTDDTGVSVAIQSDGKIVVLGNTDDSIVAVRYNANGTLDNSFNTGFTPGFKVISDAGNSLSAGGVALQADGQIVIAATFTDLSSSTARVYRIAPDGIAVASTSIAAGNATGVVVQPYDGRIVVSITDASDFKEARLNTDLSPDLAFGPAGTRSQDLGGVEAANSVSFFQGNGTRRIALGGTSGSDFAVVLLDANIDPTSNPTVTAQDIVLGGSRTLTQSILSIADLDDSAAGVTLANFVSTGGYVALASNPSVAVSSVTLAQVLANQVIFRSTGVTPGSFTLSYSVSDAFGGSDTANIVSFNAVANPGIAYVNDDWASLLDGTVVSGTYSTPNVDGTTFSTSFTVTIGVDGFGTLNQAYTLAASGAQIRVKEGTYVEDVAVVNKPVHFRGSGAAVTTVLGSPVTSQSSAFLFGANVSGSILEAFTISRAADASGTPVDAATWNLSGLNTAGVAVQGNAGSSITIQNNTFDLNRTAIDLNNVDGVTVYRNVISDNRSGIILRNAVTNSHINENFIQANWTVGVLVLASSTENFAGTDISYNNISGNWYADIQNRSLTGGVKNFSGNYYGTTAPTALAVNSAEPGYAAQIPVSVSGGTAIAPGTATNVMGAGLADIDFTPYLGLGTDQSAQPGFQPDLSVLYVTAVGGQSGSADRIQEAVNTVADGSLTGPSRTINVLAGDYLVDADINKPLRLVGPNAGTDGAAPRVAEAVLRPTASAAADTSEGYVRIAAGSITVDGLGFDGDNTAVTSNNALNGSDVDASLIVTAFATTNNLVFTNNVVRNAIDAGVYLDAPNAVPTSGNSITHNRFQNVGIPGEFFGIGVLIQNNAYASITNNTFDPSVRIGVQTGNFYLANPQPLFTPSISNNLVSAWRIGLWHNLTYQAGSTFTIAGNTVTASVAPNNFTGQADYTGIYLTSIFNNVAADVTNNTIDLTALNTAAFDVVGYWVWNTPTASPLTIAGGTVTGGTYSVRVDNFEGFDDTSSPTNVVISGVMLTGASVAGVLVFDSPANTFGASAAVGVTISGLTTLSGAPIGVLVSGTDATVSVSDASFVNVAIGTKATAGGSGSLNNSTFTGGTTDVLLEATAGTFTIASNNQFNGSAYFIDNASANSFNFSGAAPSLFAGLTNPFRIEDRLRHSVDVGNASAGFIRIVAGNVYVTTPGTGASDESVQQAVNAAASGDTVNVEAGTFTEQVTINKPLTLSGAGQSATFIKSPASIGAADFTFGVGRAAVLAVLNTSAVTLQNFTLDGDNKAASVTGSDDFVGIGVYNSSALINEVTVTNISDAPLSGVQRGRAIFVGNDTGNSLTVSVTNSVVNNYQKNGVDFRGVGLTGIATGNTITGSGPTPVIAQNGIVFLNASGSATNNTITGHSYTGPVSYLFLGINAGTWSTGVLTIGSTANLSGNTLSANDVAIDADGTVSVSGNNFASGSPNWTDLVVSTPRYCDRLRQPL